MSVVIASAIIAGVFTILYGLSRVLAPSFNYKGAHVLITGGSSGIGLESAKEYIKKGANVTIVARNKTRLNAAVDELTSLLKNIGKESTQKIFGISCDVGSSEEEVYKALSGHLREFGDVDVLVNCAGTSVAGAFSDLKADDFKQMLHVNVLGSIYPTRVVIEGMKRKNRGRIVFVSSQVAQAALYGYSAYAASKWALRGLAESLQMELKPYNIYVSVVYPPDTDTPGYEVEMQSKPSITKKLSESGSVFKPNEVASDLVRYSTMGYFGISTGLDGWFLTQVHPGMSPANNIWETFTPLVMAPLCRVISLFYIITWDSMCAAEVKKGNGKETPTSSAATAAAGVIDNDEDDEVDSGGAGAKKRSTRRTKKVD